MDKFKWKKFLTSEEAALIATGLEDWDSIEIAETEHKLNIDQAHNDLPESASPVALVIKVGIKEGWQKIDQAKQIKEALSEEFKLALAVPSSDACIADAYELGEPSVVNQMMNQAVHSVIALEGRIYAAEGDFHGELRASRSSIAEWFFDFNELEMAERVDLGSVGRIKARRHPPQLSSDWYKQSSPQTEPVNKTQTTPETTELSTKTKNYYLKTIATLSSALIQNDLAQHTTAAEKVAIKIDNLGMTLPLSIKALGNYIKAGRDELEAGHLYNGERHGKCRKKH